ncbi:hypothetical protein KM043_005649 [Ampulex compressa]|nr:hypothetical protein KM043_005649 [Ampulex compressa]
MNGAMALSTPETHRSKRSPGGRMCQQQRDGINIGQSDSECTTRIVNGKHESDVSFAAAQTVENGPGRKTAATPAPPGATSPPPRGGGGGRERRAVGTFGRSLLVARRRTSTTRHPNCPWSILKTGTAVAPPASTPSLPPQAAPPSKPAARPAVSGVLLPSGRESARAGRHLAAPRSGNAPTASLPDQGAPRNFRPRFRQWPPVVRARRASPEGRSSFAPGATRVVERGGERGLSRVRWLMSFVLVWEDFGRVAIVLDRSAEGSFCLEFGRLADFSGLCF